MSTRVDPDLDLGGRVALRDEFSRSARAIEGSFTSMRRTLSAGAVNVFQTTAALTGGFRGLAASVFGPIGIAAALHHVGRATLQSASNAETTEMAFAQLLGGVRAARAHIDELRQFALGKPFEFTQLAETSRVLQAFGFRAQEVRGLLTDMGNVAFVSGTGYRGVHTLTRIMGNIRATGRMTFGQIGQAARAGLNIELLQRNLGMTGAELRNIARSGRTTEEVLGALRATMQDPRYAGGMDRASQTVAARLSDLSDAAEYFRVMVGEALSPRFKEILQGISDVAGNAGTLRRAARQTAEVLDIIVLSTRAVFAVFTGGFRDAGDAWRRENGRFLADTRRRFEDLYLIVQGVSSLLSGQDGRGIARIPRALHDQLVVRGLWPTALRVAAWGARVRAVIAGFVEGARTELRTFVGHLGWLGDALGLSGGRMGTTREDARRLGEQLARAARLAVEVRIALLALNVVLGAATVVTRTASAATWAWNAATRAASALRAALVWTSNTTVARWALTRATMALTTAQMRLNATSTASSAGLASRFGVIGAVIAASVASTAYLVRNHDRLQAMERRGTFGQRAHVIGIRAVTAPLGGTAVTMVMDAVRAVQTYGPRVSRAVRGVVTSAWQALRVAGTSAWNSVSQGFRAAAGRVRAFVQPMLQPVRVVSAALLLLGYTLSVGIAVILLRVGKVIASGVATVARAVGRVVADVFNALVVRPLVWIGRAVYLGLSAVLGAVAWVAAGVGRLVVTGLAWVGRGVVMAVTGIVGVARSLFAWIAPPLARAFRWVVGGVIWLKNGVLAVFGTIRDGVVRLFVGIGDAILGGFRATARAILTLYRALPTAVRPRAFAGAEGTLDAFVRGGDTPGTPPPPRPAGQGATVQELLDQRASASAGLAARGGAPTVVVRPPPPAPAPPVVVQIDGREVARAVARQAEDDRVRRGRGGGE